MNGLSPDFFAANAFKDQEELLAGVIKNESLDLWTKLRLLALGLTTWEPERNKRTAKNREFDRLKEAARAIYKEVVHSRGDANLFRKLVIAPHRRLLDELGLALPMPPDFTYLPDGSAFLSLSFTMKKPYISRDDAFFHILDNPVRKEKVFKLPMAAASGWKGNLRWMANFQASGQWLQEAKKTGAQFHDFQQDCFGHRLRLWLLFGPEKERVGAYLNKVIASFHFPEILKKQEDNLTKAERDQCMAIEQAFTLCLGRHNPALGPDQGFAGRLHFYPTYFDAIDLEVINPHDRKSGAGKNPIYIESVPRGAQGNFSLLYVPLDLMGEDKETIAGKVQKDLALVAEALSRLLLDYGFSAKKSSGFGVIEEELREGVFTLKGLTETGAQERFEFHRLAALTAYLKSLGENHAGAQ